MNDMEIAAMRGILLGILVSIPLWAAIFGVIYALHH